jgi:RNA polymerase sigma-70 factor (ECF subfamily)
MDQEDAELLAAVCEGSRRAFNLLVDRHQQALRNFLRRVVGREDADDVAQETFLAVWTQAGSFRGGAAVRSWIFGIAWRKAKDLQRSWFRRRRRDAQFIETDAPSVGAAAEEQVLLAQVLATLSLEQRAAIMLCLGHGLTNEEAAVALDMPLGTVKSHVNRGRERLRDVLGEE